MHTHASNTRTRTQHTRTQHTRTQHTHPRTRKSARTHTHVRMRAHAVFGRTIHNCDDADNSEENEDVKLTLTNTYTRTHCNILCLERRLILISNLNLLGLFSTERGKRDDEELDDRLRFENEEISLQTQ